MFSFLSNIMTVISSLNGCCYVHNYTILRMTLCGQLLLTKTRCLTQSPQKSGNSVVESFLPITKGSLVQILAKTIFASLFDVYCVNKRTGYTCMSLWVTFCQLYRLPKVKYDISFCSRHYFIQTYC